MIDDRSFSAAHEFLLGSKVYWTTRLFSDLRDDFAHRETASGKQAATADDVDELISDTTLYRYFAWLERHLQRFKYSGRYGLLAYLDQQREGLEASLDDSDAQSLVTLDPDLDYPTYYTNVDIHQHPGGVYGDEIAGFVYERGARSTTPMLGKAHRNLHERFTDSVADQVGDARRMLDMGCGFGKSSRPFYESYRDAEIVAMDLSAPCLKLAARDAKQAQARNVRFVQGKAESTGMPDESFGFVTSTMLLHEMTPPAIEDLIAESHRILEPGGRMAHLDFYHLPEPFLRFLHYTHGRRNNEPYMQPFAEMDLAAKLEEAGFVNVRIEPWEEADGALSPGNKAWRFPWTVITAEKPA